jgi:hypothetical protein
MMPANGGVLNDTEGGDVLSGDELAGLLAHLDPCAAVMGFQAPAPKIIEHRLAPFSRPSGQNL